MLPGWVEGLCALPGWVVVGLEGAVDLSCTLGLTVGVPEGFVCAEPAGLLGVVAGRAGVVVGLAGVALGRVWSEADFTGAVWREGVAVDLVCADEGRAGVVFVLVGVAAGRAGVTVDFEVVVAFTEVLGRLVAVRAEDDAGLVAVLCAKVVAGTAKRSVITDDNKRRVEVFMSFSFLRLVKEIFISLERRITKCIL